MNVTRKIPDAFPVVSEIVAPVGRFACSAHRPSENVTGVDKGVVRRCSRGVQIASICYSGQRPIRTMLRIRDGGLFELTLQVGLSAVSDALVYERGDSPVQFPMHAAGHFV